MNLSQQKTKRIDWILPQAREFWIINRLPPLDRKKCCHTVCTYKILALNINSVEDCGSDVGLGSWEGIGAPPKPPVPAEV